MVVAVEEQLGIRPDLHGNDVKRPFHCTTQCRGLEICSGRRTSTGVSLQVPHKRALRKQSSCYLSEMLLCTGTYKYARCRGSDERERKQWGYHVVSFNARRKLRNLRNRSGRRDIIVVVVVVALDRRSQFPSTTGSPPAACGRFPRERREVGGHAELTIRRVGVVRRVRWGRLLHVFLVSFDRSSPSRSRPAAVNPLQRAHPHLPQLLALEAPSHRTS